MASFVHLPRCALEVALDGGLVQECRASGLLVGTQAGASALLTY